MIIPILMVKMSILPTFTGAMTASAFDCTAGATIVTEIRSGVRLKLRITNSYEVDRTTYDITPENNQTFSAVLERDF